MTRKQGGLRPTIKVKGLTTGSGSISSEVTIVNATPIEVTIENTEPLQVELVPPIDNVWNQHTNVSTLVTEQDLTSTYSDFGAEIDMRGYNILGIWILSDVNNSLNVNLKALVKHTPSSTDLFEIDGVFTKQLWGTSGTDNKKYYELNVGSVPIVQLQAMAETVGAIPGDLTILITKRYMGGTE